MTVKDEYTERYEKALEPAANLLRALLTDYLTGVPRVDRIAVRPKSIDRFVKKAAAITAKGEPKYSDPINQIQDQIGARIVTFYLADVESVAATIVKYMNPIEVKALVPDSESEFGYFGKHFILLLPSDVTARVPDPHLLPTFFELQVKTLFQHAWAEANHDLAYKPEYDLSPEQKRKIAFTAAQSWGADMIFEELHRFGAT
jgi:putative GTP pyrophosphokinase